MSTAGNYRRILREISKVYEHEVEDVLYEVIDENNPFELHGIITGPLGTSYEGGQFKFYIELPHECPFKPPKFFFKTKIF